MPDLFIYLLKANVALSLFYLAYRLGLRRLTFYTLNRFFLLTGIVFSSVFPLVDVNDFFHRNEEALGTVVYYVPDFNALRPVVAEETFTVWTALSWLFWAGVAVMSVRLLIQMASLLRFHLMSDEARLKNRKIRVVNKEIAPFSFFKHIYLNPAMHAQEELDAVIRHEQVHVEEWHSADVMLGEVNNVFYWFNPGAWLMKTAIRENLEFITDRKILRAGVDAKVYQYSLLKVSGAPYATAIANNFNFSHLKNRIMMMNKERSSRYQVVRYVILGCMVSMLVLTLNFSRAGVRLSPLGQGTIPQLFVDHKDTVPVTVNEVVFTGVDKLDSSMPSKAGINEPVTFSATSAQKGQPLNIRFDSARTKSGEWIRYRNDQWYFDSMRKNGASIGVDPYPSTKDFILVGRGNNGKPVIISRNEDDYEFYLNGKRSDEQTLYKLDRSRITSVIVKQRGQASAIEATTTELDGEGATSGTAPKKLLSNMSVHADAIFINQEPPRQQPPVNIGGNNLKGVLIILDGKPDSTALNTTKPEDIESITVLKTGAEAIYGSKAANGAIIITTKKNKSKTTNQEAITISADTVREHNYRLEEVLVTGKPATVTFRHDKSREVVVEGRPTRAVAGTAQPRSEKELEEVAVTGRYVGSVNYEKVREPEAVIVTSKSDKLAAKPAATTERKIKLRVYPNPSDGDFKATFPIGKDGKYELKVYNSNGGEILSSAGTGKAGATQSAPITFTGAPGTYYLQVKTGGVIQTHKLIKK
ncbi:TonB-dependent receptor plug domain-containing protein [Chitinophaga horti]|uniref:TonB-dependent receptor plug domain-containing protein n=1 Tax=Chitinophaga horti TaxID=2920382 RepID=A0ABY6J6D9_9BACT|nr:TonB-dependent receptor plug domain-containing protein [Chitinophaga horti]UYQ93851.1 TonB-dependent receptor plug domain-containing protein [Chitinophaga horti]